jgi:hypothetical protein
MRSVLCSEASLLHKAVSEECRQHAERQQAEHAAIVGLMATHREEGESAITSLTEDVRGTMQQASSALDRQQAAELQRCSNVSVYPLAAVLTCPLPPDIYCMRCSTTALLAGQQSIASQLHGFRDELSRRLIAEGEREQRLRRVLEERDATDDRYLLSLLMHHTSEGTGALLLTSTAMPTEVSS